MLPETEQLQQAEAESQMRPASLCTDLSHFHGKLLTRGAGGVWWCWCGAIDGVVVVLATSSHDGDCDDYEGVMMVMIVLFHFIHRYHHDQYLLLSSLLFLPLLP